MSGPAGTGTGDQPTREEGAPPDLFAARIAVNPETLAELMRRFELDVGCRPHIEKQPDGTGRLLVYATFERIRELQAAGYVVEPGENVTELGRRRQGEVGQGDRFEGGRIPPRGLGEKPGRPRDPESAP